MVNECLGGDIYTCMKLTKIIEGLEEVTGISPKDIYNFYFLWYTAVHQPKLVSTPYGKEVMDHYLQGFRQKYIKIFRLFLAKQIDKYVSRGRVDPDFPKVTLQDLMKMPTPELRTLMAKTFRSDMKRRNDVWNLVAEFTENLERASNAKDIFTWVNQLNNAVHNTQTKVMDKLPNFYSELTKAFQVVDKATNIHLQLKSLVDKDIRDLWNQEEEGDPHEMDPSGEGGRYVERVMMREGLEKILRVKEAMPDKEKIFRTISNNDRMNPAFMSGVRDAIKDKLKDEHPRDLEGHTEDYIRGYSTIPKDSWWDKANDRLTQFVTMLGRSYGNRR